MIVHPAVFEAAVFALLGLSGVSIALLLGVRQIVPLTVLALGASVVLRVWTAFSAWSINRPDLTWELWLIGSLAVAVAGGIFCWRQWRAAVGSLSLFGLTTLIALSTKYLLDVGERHHSDSANVLALAIVAIQGDMQSTDPLADSYKRGIAYPLVLALGPEGRILSGFTPFVFLIILMAAGWLAWNQLPEHARRNGFYPAVLLVLAFSLTVPMFRAAMFYLNSHTLMGLAILMLVMALFMMQSQDKFSGAPAAFTLVGGVLGITSRVEGVLLVVVVIAAIAAKFAARSGSERLEAFAVIGLVGLSLPWWLVTLDSPALDRIGLPGWWLLPIALVGALVFASPGPKLLRVSLLPFLALGLVASLVREALTAPDLVAFLLGQWPNLALGAGGWGTAAHMFIGTVIVLGWKNRSCQYRSLIALIAVAISSIFFAKLFDGGIQNEGFSDSLNRMWLHVFPIILLTTLIGYSELIARSVEAFHRKKLPRSWSGPAPK